MIFCRCSRAAIFTKNTKEFKKKQVTYVKYPTNITYKREYL